MKKKFIPVVSALLCTAMLTACVDTDKKISFSAYWYNDVNTSVPTTETLVYDVSFEQAAGTKSAGYDAIDYDGTYTTKLRLENNLYYYETTLDIKVTFTVDGEEKVETDKVKSSVVFKNETNGFMPVQSVKEIQTHSPINGATTETYYSYANYTVTTIYDGDDDGKCTIVNNENDAKQTKSFDIETDEYTYLDNEQLIFALRGVNPSVSATPVFLVYDAFKNAVYNIKATYGSVITGKEFNFKKKGTAVKETIDYYAVNLAIDDDMPGTAQTVWVAKTTKATNNKYRNVILRIVSPLYYSMGTLVYELADADFAD